MFAVCFAVAAILAVVQGQHDHTVHRINVDVYYESLCPDSIKFFTQQLYPTLQTNLSQLVNLTLVPYGKSKTIPEIGDQYDFQCHHGPAECKGNRLQACALRTINKGQNDKNLGYNSISVAFINCLMHDVIPKGNDTVFPTEKCATVNKVPDYIANIENCANSAESSQFLKDLGEKTAALQPPLTSVPTVVFNKQYKSDDSALAQQNFVKALCQYIHGDKPAECTKSGANQMALAGAVALAALLVHL